MPRQSKPAELTLQTKTAPDTSATLQGVDLGSLGGGFEHDIAAGLTPLPTKQPSQPQSPPTSPRPIHSSSRDTSRSFLSSFKSRPAQGDQQKDNRQSKQKEEEYRPNTSSVSKIYHLRNNPGSTPSLSLVGSDENMRRESADGGRGATPDQRPPTQHQPTDENTAAKRKDKSFRMGMPRSKSISRRDSHSKSQSAGKDSFEGHANTASTQSDWPGSDSRMTGKGKEKDNRGKSAERATPVPTDSEENLSTSYPRYGKEAKGGFKAGSKNVMSKAKSGGGSFFNRLGKIGRSTSSHEKDVPDNEYRIKVINLPLVEQTRITRISKQLSGCRDKTEYWMPSLPWRCIDFLNTNAEEEGLYRIPGSGPKVKHWQRRFDSELDIDLLSEEVTDTNEIASMLKAWLRELPSEMMPASLQKSLAVQLEKENPNYKNVGQPASQLLRDALSDLPPYNYYLLFAITCHLSLLLTNKEVNKMDLNNLAVCVGPCLNLERWLFNYLVGDWRHCWQGCYTEKDYLKIEEMVEAGLEPPHNSHHESYKTPEGEFRDDKSLTQSMWAATLGDDKSATNRSEWATTIGDSSENVSNSDSRAYSNGGGSVHTTSHDNARSMTSGTTVSGRAKQPQTYMPVGAKPQANGSLSSAAEQRHAKDDAVIGTTSNETTPKIGHARSRSDLPPAPVKSNCGGYDGEGAGLYGRG